MSPPRKCLVNLTTDEVQYYEKVLITDHKLRVKECILLTSETKCVIVVRSSLDIRDRPLQDGSHWSEKRILGGRAYYTTEPPYSFLILESVKEEDVGVYRCRVDFKISPTRNSLVNLTIIGESSQGRTILLGSHERVVTLSRHDYIYKCVITNN